MLVCSCNQGHHTLQCCMGLLCVQEAGRFMDYQLEEMWGHWQVCIAQMARLKPAEVKLHDRLAAALVKSVDHFGQGPKYLELIEVGAPFPAPCRPHNKPGNWEDKAGDPAVGISGHSLISHFLAVSCLRIMLWPRCMCKTHV